MSTPSPKATETKVKVYGEGRLFETKPQRSRLADRELGRLKQKIQRQQEPQPTDYPLLLT